MDDERLIILRLVQEGKITAEEAATLLDAVGGASDANQSREEHATHATSIGSDIGEQIAGRMSAFGEKLSAKLEKLGNLRSGGHRGGHKGSHSGMEDFMGLSGLSGLAGLASLAGIGSGGGPGIEITETITGDMSTVDEVSVLVETRNGAVAVKPWEGPGYKVVAVKKVRADNEDEARQLSADALGVSVTGGQLQISADENHNVKSVSIATYLPVGRRYDLTAETTNGQVGISGLQFSACRAETTNGAINISSISADGLSAESTNGGIRIENVQAATVEGETTNGSIRWQGSAANVRLETTNGSIKAYPRVSEVQKPELGQVTEATPRRAVYHLESCNGSIGVGLADIAGTAVSFQAESNHGRISVPDNASITRQHKSPGSQELAGTLAGSNGDHLELTIETTHGSISIIRADESR